MNRLLACRTVFLLAIFVSPALDCLAAAEPPRRPNVVLIVTDDQGYGDLGFTGNAFFSLGRDLNTWPQGRNVTQYGIVDDFSKVKGNHALKIGINFHRNDVTDFSPGLGTIGFSQGEDLSSFFNGLGVSYAQNFSGRPTQPVAVYGLGFYGQDEWSIRPHFKLTLSLRGGVGGELCDHVIEIAAR
jgi:outer membrane receptor protein involved in Fe transport